jgi:hypothetical protein
VKDPIGKEYAFIKQLTGSGLDIFHAEDAGYAELPGISDILRELCVLCVKSCRKNPKCPQLVPPIRERTSEKQRNTEVNSGALINSVALVGQKRDKLRHDSDPQLL